ncbi:MAG: fumarylacetoacetate hydrolase family protein [Armatimonadota bacterium]|nr:fumarylacetoacetate hydrolase family protein [Armatimonadota bacterium]MDR7451850.1 fumarylacetoacetate hydrolase family protein [Armatimonadota bacterium]MDR7467575.1 fumarylacetoacetate hydrolase family protein [Armatimonadota bacterium]MDR7494464.1 fumarylacetoacetate hydrolase family protein [Armatimonadota bacterium]MDR7499725.1 fumarylacetoacetate hydrolase family protein [Armatimonadota bacterium]
MRLCTYQIKGDARLGIVVGEAVVDLHAVARRRKMRDLPREMLGLIAEVPAAALRALAREAERWVAAGRPTVPLRSARLLAPIPRPRKNIVCMGRNYAEHAREGGNEPPAAPVFFTKPPTAVVGPDAPVIHHAVTEQLDYEVELVAVIGRRGRDIPEERALDYVFGYTIMNDVTARDLQDRHLQWFKGKALDTFAPLGPWIVHRSAIPDPQRLRLSLRVNGEVRQQSTTAHMIFPVARLISVLSAGMTLEPGDLLATGTPEGVAKGMKPPRWLRPGDVMEAEVEGIGVLRNRVVAPR